MIFDDQNPLYEYIKENIKDGELPHDFSLPKEQRQDSVSFADGAMDGICLYHMGHSDVSEEDMKQLTLIMQAVTDSNFETGERLLHDFSVKNSALKSIDRFERYIMDNTQWIDASNLHRFALNCLMSHEKETVKFGLEMIEVFSEPNEELKDMVRILALSDEFTVFAVFNMMNWENSNEEIFSIAKKVRGWGRIHAVERLEPLSDDIKEWLLDDGIMNDVYPSYSALTVFEKIGGSKLLKEQLSDSQLNSLSQIIFYLLDEGPVQGISAVENAEEMLSDFLEKAAVCTLSTEICNTVFALLKNNDLVKVHDKCEDILKSEKCRTFIEDEVCRGNGVEIAKYLGISYKESLFGYMKDNFNEGFHNCSQLMEYDEYRPMVLELFREHLPMSKMAGGPADIMGLGKEYSDYSKLAFLIQSLCAYPMCGVDFVTIGLKSPVINNRNISLRAAHSWCKAKKCSLKELSEDLFSEVENLKENEVSKSVKENIEKYGF